MFDLLFGFFWTVFSIAMFFAVKKTTTGNIPLFVIGVLFLFIGVGVFVFVRAVWKVFKDYNTDKHGDDFYGFIEAVYPDGNYVNRLPEYKADVMVYEVSSGKSFKVSEVIGFDPNKYPINSYVKGKCCDGDINIKEKINDFNLLPLNVQNYFREIENSNSPDTIEVNGVKYKRVDEEDNNIL